MKPILTCPHCSDVFEQRTWRDRRCTSCGVWVPGPTRAQYAKVDMLAAVLRVDPPVCHGSPQDAARVIDELRVLCELDPDVRLCAVDGCDYFVNSQRPIAHTYCSRHKALRSSRTAIEREAA